MGTEARSRFYKQPNFQPVGPLSGPCECPLKVFVGVFPAFVCRPTRNVSLTLNFTAKSAEKRNVVSKIIMLCLTTTLTWLKRDVVGSKVQNLIRRTRTRPLPEVILGVRKVGSSQSCYLFKVHFIAHRVLLYSYSRLIETRFSEGTLWILYGIASWTGKFGFKYPLEIVKTWPLSRENCASNKMSWENGFINLWN